MLKISTENFYNVFSSIYDFKYFQTYYEEAKEEAINRLKLSENQIVLDVACGTGQNFEYFQKGLQGTGLIIGMDFSDGMLKKAEQKVKQEGWENVMLVHGNAEELTLPFLCNQLSIDPRKLRIDAVICSLGLTTMLNWHLVIENMVHAVKEEGKVVVMDWYMKKLTLRGRAVNWVGQADIRRPTWHYLQKEVESFTMDNRFHYGDVFVASGTKRKTH